MFQLRTTTHVLPCSADTLSVNSAACVFGNPSNPPLRRGVCPALRFRFIKCNPTFPFRRRTSRDWRRKYSNPCTGRRQSYRRGALGEPSTWRSPSDRRRRRSRTVVTPRRRRLGGTRQEAGNAWTADSRRTKRNNIITGTATATTTSPPTASRRRDVRAVASARFIASSKRRRRTTTGSCRARNSTNATNSSRWCRKAW